MNGQWLGQWVMELAQEMAVYAHIYEERCQGLHVTVSDRENWMDRWMQYKILLKIGESLGCSHKTVTFNPDLCVVEPEKLLYNEKENYNQFQAIYESLEEPLKPWMMRVMVKQQGILRRLGNGG